MFYSFQNIYVINKLHIQSVCFHISVILNDLVFIYVIVRHLHGAEGQ